MRFAFCNEGFRDRPWPAVCSAIAGAGYDGVEIAPFTFAESVQQISAAQRGEIRDVAREAGLEVVGLHWLLVKPEGLHIASPQAAVRARTRDYLRHLVDFCGDVGGAVMVFGSPRQRSRPEGVEAEQAWRWAVDTFAGVLEALAERGVTLCIEPLTPEETDFVNTAQEARRLVEELNSAHFRLILDVKAMSAEAEPAPQIIRKQADILAHVHANDANRQAPGYGEVDFRPILEALRGIGYGRYVSVEPFEFAEEVDAVARRAMRYLRECLPP